MRCLNDVVVEGASVPAEELGHTGETTERTSNDPQLSLSSRVCRSFPMTECDYIHKDGNVLIIFALFV